MNVRPDQLESALNKGLQSVYLVSGDEPLQVMEAVDLIRASFKAQEYHDREIFDIDAKFDWQIFVEEAASMSLFSTQRILDVRIPSGKPGRQGSQIIKQYLDNPPQDTVLIITAGKVDRKSAWYKAVDKAGMTIECWPVKAEELPAWVMRRFKKLAMTPDMNVVSYVCQNIEGNLLAASQEIEKIHLMLGPGEIDFDSVKTVLTDNTRYSIFELADFAMKGDKARVMKIVDTLHAEGETPVLIIWALSRGIRILNQVAGNRTAAEYALRRHGVWSNQMSMFKDCLSRHTEKSLRALLQRCAKVDAISKGFDQGSIWDELRMLSFMLASSPANISR
jgi:DNA polymerase-3 subunit delta